MGVSPPFVFPSDETSATMDP
jgi:hypothetical protein